MNAELVKHYISQPILDEVIKKFESLVSNRKQFEANIIGELNYLTNHRWTYEIEQESFLDDGTAYHVTISLYLPGRVMTGNAFGNVNMGRDFKSGIIISAIFDAVDKMFSIGPAVPQRKEAVWIVPQEPKTNADFQAPSAPPAHTAPPVASVTQQIQQQAPPPRVYEYTQAQVDGMNKFKKDFNITTEEQLMTYVKTWNPQITLKTQLTPPITDEFLVYVKRLTEGGI